MNSKAVTRYDLSSQFMGYLVLIVMHGVVSNREYINTNAITCLAFLSYSLLFNKEYERKERQVSFIHRTLNFKNLKETREVPIQALVNRVFVTQHRSKARVTFA